MRKTLTTLLTAGLLAFVSLLIVTAQDKPAPPAASSAAIPAPTPDARIVLNADQRGAIEKADQSIQTARIQFEAARANLQAAELAYQNTVQGLFIASGGSNATHEPRLVAFDQKGEKIGFDVKAPAKPAKKEKE